MMCKTKNISKKNKLFYISICLVLFSLGIQAQQLKEFKTDKTILELSNIDAYFQNQTSSKVLLPYETKDEYNKRMQ